MSSSILEHIKSKAIIRALIRGTVGDYVVSFYNGKWKCSCPHHFYRKVECKHIRKVKEMFSLEDILSGKIVTKYESSLKCLEEMIGDKLYTSDGLIAIFSQPEVGKTLTAIQESAWMMTKGYNVLFIGTEGNEASMMGKWLPKFKERFGDFKGTLYLERRKTLESLFEFLGFKIFLDYKGKVKEKKGGKKEFSGKTEFRVVERIPSRLEEIVKNKKINFIVLDSITAPMKGRFYGSQQDNPAKAGAMALILSELIRMQDEYDCAVLITVHESFNPANPYEGIGRATGGINLYHFCKRIFYIDRRDATAEKNYRRIWVIRSEDIVAGSRATAVKINDLGIHCLPEKEVQERFTKGELEKMRRLREE